MKPPVKLLPTLEAVLTFTGLMDHDCHGNLPRDQDFKGIGLRGGAICLEEAFLIGGIIAATKPDQIIELGTSRGASSVCIAALAADLGSKDCNVVTVDMAKEPPKEAQEIAHSLALRLSFVCGLTSLQFLSMLKPDMNKKYLVFSDTDIKVRPDEVNHVKAIFPKGTVVLVHDTSDLHPFGPMNLKQKVSGHIVEFPTPRGISVLVV